MVIKCCRNCQERQGDCHAKCEKYKREKSVHEAERQERLRKILLENEADRAIIDGQKRRNK